VTSLEPRTLHQSAKLQNVPKNDCLFTLSIFTVNQNCAIASALKSIECSPYTTPCHLLVQPQLAFFACLPIWRNPRGFVAFRKLLILLSFIPSRLWKNCPRPAPMRNFATSHVGTGALACPAARQFGPRIQPRELREGRRVPQPSDVLSGGWGFPPDPHKLAALEFLRSALLPSKSQTTRFAQRARPVQCAFLLSGGIRECAFWDASFCFPHFSGR